MSHSVPIAHRLGRYELSRLIGRGGMAEVFEGYSIGDGGFRRRVAIKRLLPTGTDDPGSLRMFLDEARICSVLHHRNIVSILDFGIIDESPFQVMEYVDGVNALQAATGLAQARERISEVVALHVCRSVALALAHAHEAADEDGPLGIVHRDVKPGNILLSWDGEVKLADFGIALGRVRTERTEAGLVKGTPSYMAPEQLAGLAVDGRADLFALGCVLHALLAGKSPMSSVSALDLLRGSEIKLDPIIVPDIAAVIGTCLKAHPEDRFASARAMAAHLDGLIAVRTKQGSRADLEAVLRPLRAPAIPRRGKLDDLLELALVPEAAPGSTPEYASLARADETTEVAPKENEESKDEEDTHAAAPVKVEAVRRRLALWPAVLGGIAVAGAGAWGASRAIFGQHGATEQPTFAEPRAAASLAPATSAPADRPEGASPALLPSGPTEPRPSADLPLASSSPLRRTESPSVRSAPKRAPSGPVRPANGTGFVAFRAADGATRTTIVVDGIARGFAPRILELPLGPHAISFLDQAGTPFGSASVEVRPENSRESPRAVDVTAGGASR